MAIDLKLGELRRSIEGLPVSDLPDALAELERLKVSVWVRLLASANGSHPAETKLQDGRWLTAVEAAALLRVTPRWLYRHQKKLPFARRLTRKCLRFSEAGLRRWQAKK